MSILQTPLDWSRYLRYGLWAVARHKRSMGILDKIVTKPNKNSSKPDRILRQAPRADAETVDDMRATQPTVGRLAQIGLRHCGNYELLEEVARGGMGIVYRAKDKKLDRIVAVKMILDRNLASQDDIARFRGEAQATAHLSHPGIVPVYDVGEQDGHHYYAMGYVPGPTLADKLKHGIPPIHEGLSVLMDIANAVHYAHTQGVVHRDLKPSNILMGDNDQPRITDFGLAKRADHSSQLTTAGQIMGTPGYMAPEQASGHAFEVGPEVDVYALGALLYHVLTGHAPFHQSIDILSAVLEQDPTPPRILVHSVQRDLSSICMKCLTRRPENRYESANQFKEELQRFINGEPVMAHTAGVVPAIGRWMKREPRLAVTVMAAFVFYTYHLITYLLGEPGISVRFHATTTGLVIAWCSIAWIYQQLVLKPNPNRWLPTLWVTTDVLLLTGFLMFAAAGAHSPLVSIYFGLVAAAALWFKQSVVNTVACVSSVCYLGVVVHSNTCRPELERITYMDVVPIILMIFIISMIQNAVIWCIRRGIKSKA